MQPAAKMMIQALRSAALFNAIPKDGTGEWIKLTSPLPDDALFRILQTVWPRLSWDQVASFALLLCRSNPDKGVWLHHLSTPALKADYWSGCHDIPHWNC